MKRSSFLLRAFSLAIAALTLIATVTRSLCFVFAFDRTVGYFDRGVLSTLLYIALALILAAALAYALLARRANGIAPLPCPDPAERTLLVRIPSLSVAAALTVTVVTDILSLTSNGLNKLTLVHLLVTMLAIPYFAASRKASLIWSGIAAVTVCGLSVITEYFDLYVTINSPIKQMHLIGLLSATLYLLTELFALAGDAKPYRSLPLCMLTAAYGIVGGVSHVVAALAGGILSIDYLSRALVLFALGLYAAARLIDTVRAVRPNDSTTED